jgi:hypothetical protein
VRGVGFVSVLDVMVANRGSGEAGHDGVGVLSPLPGLVFALDVNPRLTPWATFCRPSGPEVVASGIRVVGERQVLSLVYPSSSRSLFFVPLRAGRTPARGR